MGEKENNILGISLILPPTPEGYTMLKPFEIPTEPNGHELLLIDPKKNHTTEEIIIS